MPHMFAVIVSGEHAYRPCLLCDSLPTRDKIHQIKIEMPSRSYVYYPMAEKLVIVMYSRDISINFRC